MIKELMRFFHQVLGVVETLMKEESHEAAYYLFLIPYYLNKLPVGLCSCVLVS